MPLGTKHTVTGIIVAGRLLPILRVDGGGEWQLNMPFYMKRRIGRHVRITGIRDGYNVLAVMRIKEQGPQGSQE